MTVMRACNKFYDSKYFSHKKLRSSNSEVTLTHSHTVWAQHLVNMRRWLCWWPIWVARVGMAAFSSTRRRWIISELTHMTRSTRRRTLVRMSRVVGRVTVVIVQVVISDQSTQHLYHQDRRRLLHTDDVKCPKTESGYPGNELETQYRK